MLSQEQKDAFVSQGFLRMDNAFSRHWADEARPILWGDTGCDPDNPATWTKPVIRLGMYADPPFIHAANTPQLLEAFDDLVGEGNWLPCRSMGTFPVRFPSETDPGDTGWHVDASFSTGDPTNYLDWRINYRSRGRALLMLFLFSDVGESDAPTRISVGSHLDVAALLAPEGESGLSFMELADRLPALPKRDQLLATGPAGTVYLCHPFLVHAAQPHNGKTPKFMAQPPLLLKRELTIDNTSGGTPLVRSIKLGISHSAALQYHSHRLSNSRASSEQSR